MIAYSTFYFYLFGVLTIIGGVVGFVKAGSKASLIAGGVAGLLLLLAAWLTGSSPRAGWILALVVSLLLAGRFLPVFLRTFAAMPAGLMSVLSLVGLVLAVVQLVRLA